MSFTVQVGPVLAARLNSMSCSYWSSQASSKKGLSCIRAPRKRSSFLLLILRVGARMVFLVYEKALPFAPLQHGVTLLLKQSKQLFHMFSASAEIDRVDAKPSLSLELGGRHPETPTLLDSLRHLRMQCLRCRFTQLGAFETNADRGHGR